MIDDFGQQLKTAEVPRQRDGSAFILHCGGGFRAGQIDKDLWKIVPILVDGRPCVKWPLTRQQLQKFTSQYKLSGIAFESMGWTNGTYHSIWTPINPGRDNHFLGPADLWRNIASNITKSRTDVDLRNMVDPSRDKVATLLDSRADVERLAQSISLSLRSVDISIGQIVDFYHEQLVDLMALGSLKGQRRSTSLDQTLYAHVHSFFMHLGAARDYLAAFMASAVGKDSARIDSLARLTEVLRSQHFGQSPILQLMRARGYLMPKPSNGHRWTAAGWLEEIGDLRNHFIHKRPYGERFFERAGYAYAIDVDQGVYRYFRPVVLDKNADRDLLDVLANHYRHATAFFQDAAHASGLNSAVMSITDKDIISSRIFTV